MKRKRITAILAVVYICVSLICIPTLADDVKSWRQKADKSGIDVTYSGRVRWTDKGIAPNVHTYYANLTGSDVDLITTYNSATLNVKSGILHKAIINYKLYFGADTTIHSTSKSTTAASIIAKWTFDGYGEEYTMK